MDPRLTLHSQEAGAYELLAFLHRFVGEQVTLPEHIICLDPPGDAARDITDLGVRVIARHFWRYDFSPDTVRSEATVDNVTNKAHEFVNACRAQSWYPHVWATETPPAMVNTSTPDLFDWAIAFWQECIALFAKDGKECIVGNWSTGHDGFYVPSAHLYGVQEYGWPAILSQAPYHGLRYQSWFPAILAQEPQAKLFITECGVTALEAPEEVKRLYDGSNDGPGQHGLDIGYKGGHGIPVMGSSAFLAALLAYGKELEGDAYVLGGAYFQYGGNADWDSHDIAGDTVVEDGLLALYTKTALDATTPRSDRGIGGAMGYREQYPQMFAAWDAAGGVESNFAAYVIGQRAAGKIPLTDAERAIVADRLHSAAKEYALADAAPKA